MSKKQAGEQYVLRVRTTMFPKLTAPYQVCEGEPVKVAADTTVAVVQEQCTARVLVQTVRPPVRYGWVEDKDLMTPIEAMADAE